jgi:hypothetical protein
VLLQIDDEYGFDPLLVVKAPADGVYLVRTFGFPSTPNSTIGFAGAENYVYRLTITTDGYVDHALPLAVSRGEPTTVALAGWNLPKDLLEMTIAPGEGEETMLSHPRLGNSLPLARTSYPTIVAEEKAAPAAAQVIELPCVVSGRIASRRQAHAFAFQAVKGQKLAFQVDSRTLGYPLDVLLTMTDRTGKTYVEVDDTGREASDATLGFTVPADGEYVLVVRDLHDRGGERFAYRMTCGEQPPDYSLSLAAGEFVIAAGKTLEIPVTVDRLAGFKEEIAVSIEGLPAGVTAESAASAGSGATAKAVKVKLTAAAAAKPASGAMRIVGAVGDSASKAATFVPFEGAPVNSAAWLTLTVAK